MYENHVYPAATTSELLKAAQDLGSGNQSTQCKSKSSAVRRIEASSHREFKDAVLNATVALANETARAGYGALVFAGSRRACESDAKLIARVMPQLNELDLESKEKRVDLLAALRSLSTGLDPVLEETIPCGVAFHREWPRPSRSVPC